MDATHRQFQVVWYIQYRCNNKVKNVLLHGVTVPSKTFTFCSHNPKGFESAGSKWRHNRPQFKLERGITFLKMEGCWIHCGTMLVSTNKIEYQGGRFETVSITQRQLERRWSHSPLITRLCQWICIWCVSHSARRSSSELPDLQQS